VADQVKALDSPEYTCITPDLLGYRGTSKPIETEAYNSEGQSQDIVDIIDTEKVEKASLLAMIGWDYYLAGRFANWHRRCTICRHSPRIAQKYRGARMVLTWRDLACPL
jgi:hypothetical protein